MLSCFEFTAFIWKAKGRHGTHSPFAYFLVDVVRRVKVDPDNHVVQVVGKCKTAHFIAQLSTSLPDFEFVLFSGDKTIISAQKKQLIFFDHQKSQTSINCIYQFALHPESIVIISAQHIRKQKQDWKVLCENLNFHFSADAWFFGLLSLRPHQAKQHFLLKLA